MIVFFKFNFPMILVVRLSVGLYVGQSVIKVGKVTLPCSYRMEHLFGVFPHVQYSTVQNILKQNHLSSFSSFLPSVTDHQM